MKNETESEFRSAEPDVIIDTLNLYRKEAALISPQLMVLRQTEQCAAVLEVGQFYSAEDWLPQSVCAFIRRVFVDGEAKTTEIDIDGLRRNLRVIPMHGVALLLFDPIIERLPGLILAGVRVRESASNLLSLLPEIDDPKTAARIRREAMRLLRQAVHYEVVGGEEGVLQKTMCDLGEIVTQDAEKLRKRGFRARAEAEENLFLPADSTLLEEAILTLASNSVRFGGEEVEIVLKAEKVRDQFVITVQDNGVGMSESPMLRQRTAWQDPETSLLDEDWGMGVPFAERVTQMHGGQLRFVFGKKGCTVCLVLPENERAILQSPNCYVAVSIDPADIELSAVLGSEAYL